MRVANALLAACSRLRRENFTIIAVVLSLEDRNELSTEMKAPHLAQFQGVPIIISSKVSEPSVAIT